MPRAKKKKADPPDPFDVHTVACPRMRRKWRPDSTPELAAWLVMMRERVHLSLLHAQQMAKAYKADEAFQACTTFAVRLNFLDELLGQIHDRWTEAAWLTATTKVTELVVLAERAAKAQQEDGAGEGRTNGP